MDLRKFARGQQCTLMLPRCNHDPATTVLAHGRGAGMATKLNDHIAVHACSDCHAWLDGASREDYDRAFYPALLRTLHRLNSSGLLLG